MLRNGRATIGLTRYTDKAVRLRDIFRDRSWTEREEHYELTGEHSCALATLAVVKIEEYARRNNL
jgi:hypothetical protein